MSCIKRPEKDFEWVRYENNPVYRDHIEEEAYQSASDAHVFFDQKDELKMIYSGDHGGNSSIKLATGKSWTSWESESTLLGNERSADGLDINKETAFYRLSESGKHQIYYIGSEENTSYRAPIYLAEADDLEGPYTISSGPVVSSGNIAGHDVYCMTSPSVVMHDSLLHLVFIGWNASPSEVSEVWVLGATSDDDGHTWTNFQEVETPIGMEGQLTQTDDGKYIAVYTTEYEKREGIYYATGDHPFGPFQEEVNPIIVQNRAKLERNEIIAPQIIIDPETGEEHLYYTGAWHVRGWWIMMATRP
ncbi:MAG: hypothetical protein Salg2KO_19900 [Salibacteraceae bacterium]